jgi:hypothetical protein
MDQSQMHTVETQHRMDPIVHRPGLLTAPGTARIRSGVRTGTTPHFRLWMADLQMRSALQKTRTGVLAEHVDEPLVSSAMALFTVAGIRNVWALIRADKADLLQVKGIGPNRLKAVEKYLIDHNVKPSWTVGE